MLILPGELARFRSAFEAGRYWESHERLEASWRNDPNPLRHGLILYASAYVHLLRDNAHGVLAQLGKARRELEGLPDTIDQVDVAALLLDLERLRQEVERRRDAAHQHLADLAGHAVIHVRDR